MIGLAFLARVLRISWFNALVLQTRKHRPREGKSVSWGHTAGCGWSQAQNLALAPDRLGGVSHSVTNLDWAPPTSAGGVGGGTWGCRPKGPSKTRV